MRKILTLMKNYFCTEGLSISATSAADEFLYDFKTEVKKTTKTFNSVPGKHAVYYQLVGEFLCYDTVFLAHFDIYKPEILTRTSENKVSGIITKLVHLKRIEKLL